MANVKVRLVVDTKNIDEDNKNRTCNFVDSRSTLVGFNPPDYETVLKAGQTIEWSGTPLDPFTFDSVSIDSISKESENSKEKEEEYDLFGAPVLIGCDGKICATIVADATPRDEETYTISFTVVSIEDGKSTSYSIDPKLQMM